VVADLVLVRPTAMSSAALFLIGSVAGYLAFVIGKWRHTCLFWMAENRANVPLGWHKTATPLGSLILVAVLSIVFATSWALLIAKQMGNLLGLFAWGVLLAARWYASQVSAFVGGQKEKKQIEIDIATRKAERERSRIEDIPFIQALVTRRWRQKLTDYSLKSVVKRSRTLRLGRPNQSLEPTAGRCDVYL